MSLVSGGQVHVPYTELNKARQDPILDPAVLFMDWRLLYCVQLKH